MININKEELNRRQLAEYFEYDNNSESGLRRIKNKSTAKAGSIAGGLDKTTGYFIVSFNNKSERVHRIIWLLIKGPIPKGYYIDHIDGNRANNDINNLRLATPSENQHNSRMCNNNKVGHKGIIQTSSGSFQGRVRDNYKRYYTKTFKKIEGAIRALNELRDKLHGSYARQG